MALKRPSESNTTYLQVKDYCLWKELKKPVEGCDEIEVRNPATNLMMTKYGFRFESVTGYLVNIEKYDRKYDGKRYFGFNVTIQDGDERYVIQAPYQSQFLRRLLHVAPNIDPTQEIMISCFKGKDKKGGPSLAVWFRQGGETVKHYYTRETPHGMPPARQDPNTQEWDFREQQSWLVDQFKTQTIPAVLEAGKRFSKTPPRAEQAEQSEPDTHDGGDHEPFAPITDDDVPF